MVTPFDPTTVVVVDCCLGIVVEGVLVDGVVVDGTVVVGATIGLGAPMPAAPAPGLAPGAAGIHVLVVVPVEGIVVVVAGTVVVGIVVVGFGTVVVGGITSTSVGRSGIT